MRAAALIIALLVGCNDQLGLNEVTAEPADLDHDGIVYDNCPLEPNPGQLDSDGDGLGDLCDPCPAADTQTFVDDDRDQQDDGCDPCLSGRQHDEDHDGVYDACDNCPVTPNAGQLDTDGDTVGDTCDPRAAASDTIVFFDGFAPHNPLWTTLFTPPWMFADDQASLAMPPGAALPRLRSPTMKIDGSTWVFEIAVRVDTANPTDVGIQLDSPAVGTKVHTCQLSCASGTCSTAIAGEAVSTATFPSGVVRLRWTLVRPFEGDKMTCGVVEYPSSTISIDDRDGEGGFTIEANNPVTIFYAYVQT